MHCPFCGHEETKVNDSRLAAEGQQIRRRRECLACGERFTTFETEEERERVPPLVQAAVSDSTDFDIDAYRLKSELARENEDGD
mgnify:CR=1 FL=1